MDWAAPRKDTRPSFTSTGLVTAENTTPIPPPQAPTHTSPRHAHTGPARHQPAPLTRAASTASSSACSCCSTSSWSVMRCCSTSARAAWRDNTSTWERITQQHHRRQRKRVVVHATVVCMVDYVRGWADMVHINSPCPRAVTPRTLLQPTPPPSPFFSHPLSPTQTPSHLRQGGLHHDVQVLHLLPRACVQRPCLQRRHLGVRLLPVLRQLRGQRLALEGVEGMKGRGERGARCK